MPDSPPTLLLNPRTLQVGSHRGWVDITDSECSLLRAFALSPGHRLSRGDALSQVGKAGDPAARRAFEVQLVRLRKKLLAAGADGPTLKAIRGFGYQLCIALDVHSNGLPPASASPSVSAIHV